MAEEISTERRKLSTFRDKILPTVLAAILISTAGGVVTIRDTVQQHSNDLAHCKAQGHTLEQRTADYILMQHKVDQLIIQLGKCQLDIRQLEKESTR